MPEVYSSTVADIDYRGGNLYVTWRRSGMVSIYEGVPEKLATEVMNAPSINTALNDQIKGVYEHRYG